MSLVLLIAAGLSTALLAVLYKHIGINNVKSCLAMLLTRKYWEPHYNKIEAASWFTKGIIIFPGLVFDMQLWWLYIFSLTTSSMLIWASMKKLLPTLLLFNSLWVFLSLCALVKHFALEWT